MAEEEDGVDVVEVEEDHFGKIPVFRVSTHSWHSLSVKTDGRIAWICWKRLMGVSLDWEEWANFMLRANSRESD